MKGVALALWRSSVAAAAALGEACEAPAAVADSGEGSAACDRPRGLRDRASALSSILLGKHEHACLHPVSDTRAEEPKA